MESNRFESLVLILAIIGAAVLGNQTLGIGFGAAAVGDLAILLAMFAFDGIQTRSGGQSIAFSGVAGYCLLTPLTFLANIVLGVAFPQGPSWTVSGLWLVLTLIMFGVDRFRMSSRNTMGFAETGLSSGPVMPITTAPATKYRPAPIRVEPTPAQAAPQRTPEFAPVNVVQPPSAFPAPEPVFSATSVSIPSPQPAPAALPANNVMYIPPGKEALIYLNLIGEGLNVLRTVRAENLGRDYYRIADIMPEGEQWEFEPGMVVRCKKKSLSNGKQMVAYEEAPRAS